MTEEAKTGASGGEVSWSGIERRRMAPDPETPAEPFLPVPAGWQHRRSASRYWRNGTCASVPQNTMPMVKLHSPGDSPGRRSSFHP